MPDLRFEARVQHILATTLAALPDEDRQARITYCQDNDEHGVRAARDGDLIRFTWGGQLLALVEASVFDDDAYLSDLDMTVTQEVPDDPRDLA